MANLKEVRIRIESVNSTKQITSAMKLVAASKLRRAQASILQLRPYAQKLQEFLQGLSAGLNQSDEAVYSETRDVKNVLLIVITSNRGLCGAFNTNIIKQTEKLIQTTYKKQYDSGKLSLFCIGKKGADHFIKHAHSNITKNTELFENPDYTPIHEIDYIYDDELVFVSKASGFE